MKAHEIPGRGALPGRRVLHPLTGPLQVFEKLPGFAGNTNVIDVTEKTGTAAA